MGYRMSEAYLEVTEWLGNTPNHIYLLEGDSALAYINRLTNKISYFSQPMRINKKGRKFVKLDKNPFGTVESKLIEVAGSKGNVYYVDPDKKTCTCPGYTYRGTCKHLGEVK